MFLVANVALVILPVNGLDMRRIESRSAFMAVINMIPLFLTGRAGFLFKLLNVHQRTYRNFHRFIGATVFIEAMIHASITFILKPKPGLLATSGVIVR